MITAVSIEVVHLYVSDGHNFFGRHGQPPGEQAMREVRSVQCLAGRGIAGDRFCDYKNNYKGQITFFATEVYEALCRECGIFDVPPSAFRRNVITRGIDLNALIGERFDIQGVSFEGTEECRPCHWMNTAFHAEAEERLRGRGGLRARILTTGRISTVS